MFEVGHIDGSGPDTSSQLSEGPRLLAPRGVLGIIARISLIGGGFTVVSMLFPHEYTRYDAWYYTLAAVLLLVGGGLLALSRGRRRVTHAIVQTGCWYLTAMVLALTWLGMPDLAGVQAVFLMLVLGVSALAGPGVASTALLFGQSAGYATVLATSSERLALDRPGQWTSLTMGLVVCLFCMRAIRSELVRVSLDDATARDERERERLVYAEQLERVNDELRDAIELKSRFVAMASHELRTPLTAISGFASTMTFRWDELTDADKRSFVEIIDDQAARLARLVSDLLTLSKIESGRVSANAQRLFVHEQVERTLRELGMRGVQLECEATLAVEADEGHLQQILVNYLTNARSYGQEPFRVEARQVDDWVHVVVCDSGDGVEEEFVPVLFDRFTRGARTAGLVLESGGTGLGLSIVEGLAHAHGGQAWYEPNEPSGSRFGVSLPASV